MSVENIAAASCRVKRVFAALCFLPVCAFAAPAPYLGASAGLASATNFRALDFDISGTLDPSRTSEKKDAVGGRVFVGLELMRALSIEAAYVDLGKSTLESQSTGTACCFPMYAPGPVHGSIHVKGFDVSLLGGWRFHDFAIHGRVGMFRSKMVSQVSDSSGQIPTSDATNTDPYFGINLAVPVWKDLWASLDYISYKIKLEPFQQFPRMDQYNESFLGLGLTLRLPFHNEETQSRRAPAAPYAPSASEPAPITGTVPSPAEVVPARAAGPVTTVAAGTQLRNRPTADGPVVITLAKTTEVEVLGEASNAAGDWRMVRADGTLGWARLQDLQLAH